MSSADDFERALAALKRLMPGTARRLGDDQLAWVVELAASLDEIRGQTGLRQILGRRAGVVVAVVPGLPVGLGWLLGGPGVAAGMVLSAAFVLAWRSVRAARTCTAIHPGGAPGCAASQRLLARHREAGTEQHRISRMYWTHWTARFAYGEAGPPRPSWRVYALGIAILAAGLWSALVAVALVLLVAAFVAHAITTGRAPVALYLGPSTLQALRQFWRIRCVTGIGWASLLRDPIEAAADAEDTIEHRFDLFTNFVYGNPWSLRRDDNDDWFTIVQDFVSAAAVIVVQVADVPAVQRELALLGAGAVLDRVIVIADGPDPTRHLPAALWQAVMAEADALALLSLVATDPRAFRARLRERAGSSPGRGGR